MTTIRGELDLSEIGKDQLHPAQTLRVAVVREGTVLGSVALTADAPRIPFEVAFEPVFLPGARLPCPIILLVGPDVADAELFGAETLSHVVRLDLGKGGEGAAAAAADVRLEPIAVSAAILARWRIFCRRFVVHGRVVCRQWSFDPATGRWGFCDAPVPGATVQAFDVRCCFWWCWRDYLDTATTDINGNFTLHFRRCCLFWTPWLRPDWVVDPDRLARIQAVLQQAGVRIPPLPPGPDPMFLQELAANAAIARGRAALAAPAPAGGAVSSALLTDVLPPSAELAALRIWPWCDWDCDVNLALRVTQVCDGAVRVIYADSNASARPNIPNVLNVTLVANASACCRGSCHDPECPECIKLTWVGCTPTSIIGTTAGPPDLRGFAGAASALDRPFFGGLQLRGGIGFDVDYFRVQYSFDGGSWTDMTIPVFGGYGRSYWDGSTFIGVGFSPVVKVGRTVIMTRQRYEALHPAIPRFGGAVIWNDFDTLMVFDTFDTALKAARLPDGLYQLRFIGYAANAADDLILSSERVLPTCGATTAETVFIRLDNQSQAPHIVPGIPCTPIHACIAEPDCYIRRICINEGTPTERCIAACDIVTLADTDTLTIHFTASCPTTTQDGHLGGYWMRAEYGLSQVFAIGTGAHGTFVPDPTFEVGPEYAQALLQGAPRPEWYGGDYQVTLHGSDFPQSCAYLLHMRAWKRTTNGCVDPQFVHANEFELSLTVLRP